MEKLAFADYQALGPLETPPGADTIKVLKIGLSVGSSAAHCASMIVVGVVLCCGHCHVLCQVAIAMFMRRRVSACSSLSRCTIFFDCLYPLF